MTESRFRYVELSDNAKLFNAELTQQATYCEASFDRLPNGREKSLALTKLEEAVMWARKALRDVQ